MPSTLRFVYRAVRDVVVRNVALLAAMSIALVAASAIWLPSATAATGGTSTPAYVLVDHDTGNVLEAVNERVPLSPASVTKLLTALVAVSKIPVDKPIPISAQAASMPPMKIGLSAGEMWSRDDLLHSLLMVSANDAAVALAESASGSLQQFAIDRTNAAQNLGLRDNPVFNDPSGLDDPEHSFRGGDLVSARDMAIVARAALDEPLIRSIVVKQRHQFVGGDAKPHTLRNHNKLLASYAGAIGMKPGYTSKAKNTMVAAATRDGRTMIAVVMNADNPYALPAALMDRGFATPVSAQRSTDHLPRLPLHEPVVAEDRTVVSASVVDRSKEWARIAGVMFILTFLAAVFYNGSRGFRREPVLDA